MRRLYLRIYLAVLASLAVFALVAGLLWRSFGQPWWSDDTLTIVARNVLPPAAAPASEQQATLERLARDLRIDLALFAPDGAKLAGVGRPIGPPKRVGRQSGMRGPPVWAVMLEDGRWLAARYNKPGFTLYDYRVWVQCSDGDLMEGVTNEAASLAGHLKLDNLCWIYDDNHITIEGRTDLAFSEDVGASLQAGDLVVRDVNTQATILINNVGWDGFHNTATFTLNGAVPEGHYAATLSGGGVSDGAGNALGSNVVMSFTFLRGDANNDGAVNLADFNALASNFGQTGRDFTQGDFDYNGAATLDCKTALVVTQ